MLLTACLILWGGVAAFYWLQALTFDLRRIGDIPSSSVVYDWQGRPYSRLAGENRLTVPLQAVSPVFLQALIAREDLRFRQHPGIDPVGIVRALLRNLSAGGIRQGGSTLTQQLARNSYPLGGQTIHRKLLEAALALRMEQQLSKDEILEAYVNRIYFGAGLYGIETASRAYFDKPAADLDLPEAALLAGLIRSPNRTSPFNNPEASLRQRNLTLRQMQEAGFLDEAAAAAAIAAPLGVVGQRPSPPQENWAMEAVSRELELVLSQDRIDGGGLRIYTSIDPALQERTSAALARQLAAIEGRPGYPHPAKGEAVAAEASGSPYLQGAALVVDNRDGGIRAIAGGRDFAESKFNRALFSRRQVGSAAKPFVYATAFASGLRPGVLIDDARLRPGEIPRELGAYDPANSDDEYRGPLPAGTGLIESRNTMTVRVGLMAGLDPVRETLQRAGLAGDAPRFPSMFLGSFTATLKDLVAAYTVFPNHGLRRQPFLIDRVEAADGSVLYRSTRGEWPVLPPEAAATTTRLLREVMTRGTAASARALGFRGNAAGKTGTTNDYLDAWFLGFTSSLTCGVWIGFDQPRSIIDRGYGAALALPVWTDIMSGADRRIFPAGKL